MHAGDARHEVSDFIAFLLEKLQVLPKNLDCESAFGASEFFSDVVLDRLGAVPDRTRILFYRAIHGGDQFILVAVKNGPPLVLRLQVYEILRVAEAPSVGPVVGPADLRYHRFHFRKRRENQALL